MRYAGAGRALRESGPYLLAVGGVAALTLAIAVIRTRFDLPTLSLVYLLLVLWLGARFGSGPAVVASVLAFLAYDFFFIAPVGTLVVNAPTELFGLFLLLAAALVTGQLAASMRNAEQRARTSADESRSLYEVATAALKKPNAEEAMRSVCERARELASVRTFSILGSVADRLELVAGDELSNDVRRRAAWSYKRRAPVGIRMEDGRPAVLMPHPAREHEAFLPLAKGVIAIGFSGADPQAEEQSLLAALISLSSLLVDRWVATREGERLRTLETSDSLKSAILSSISHELKSPIAVLRTGLSSLGLPQARLSAAERELVGDLDRQAAQLDRLVNDLLTMSRLEAGFDVHTEPASLAELVGAVLQRIGDRLDRRDVELDFPPDLPDALMDELQMERVITNLVENAIDWSPDGSRIRIGARAHAEELEFWVANQGATLPMRELDRVFDTFWTRRQGGSGLGLAICKRIVEAHRGTIRAQNVRGGVRFTLTLPFASAEVPV